MSRRWRLAASIILGLAWSLRLWQLGAKDLWWDEALAVWAIRKPPGELTAWTAGDVHPPLFFWLQWLWRHAAGESELALRFLPAALGVMGVAVTLALGTLLAGRRAGLMAALLAAVSPFAVWWSQELRMYALCGLLVGLAAYAALRWLRDGGRERRWLWAYTALATAMLYTVYLSGVAAVALNLAVLTSLARAPAGQRRRPAGAWLAAQLAVALAFLPWWGYAAGRMQSWTSVREAAGLGEVLWLGASLLATGSSVDLGRTAPVTLLFLAAVAMLAWRVARRRAGRPQGLWLSFLIVAALPPLAIWAATQPRSVFYSPNLEARYFYPFALPVYALIGGMTAGASRGRAVLVAALLLPQLAGLPAHHGPRRLRGELRGIALRLWASALPEDALLLVSGDRYPLLEAAYGRWRPSGGPGLPPIVPFPGKAAGPLPGGWRDRLEQVTEGRRVWLVEVERHYQDPDGRVAAWLSERRPERLAEAYGPHSLRLFDIEGEAVAGPSSPTRLASDWPGCRAVAPDRLGAAPLLPLACLAAADLRSGDGLDLGLFAHRDAPATLPLWLIPDGGRPIGLEARFPPGAEPRPGRASVSVDERWPAGRYGLSLDDGGGAALPPLARLELRGGLPPAAPDAWRGEAVTFRRGAETITLTAWAMPVRVGRPIVRATGRVAAVDLSWDLTEYRGGAAPTVFVHLVDPRLGAPGPLATGDGPPLGGAWPPGRPDFFDRHLLRTPAGAPAGPYPVRVGLYDPASGERWRTTGGGSDSQAHSAELGLLDLER